MTGTATPPRAAQVKGAQAKGARARERSSLLLAICLLGGLYLSVAILVLVGAAFFLPVILALGGHVNTALVIGTEFVAVGSVPGLMLIYYCVFTLRRGGDGHPAIDIALSDAPGLWKVVGEVAAAAGTRPPTRLRVAAIANAFVFEETRLLGFAGGERYLTIGLPLLLGTTGAELRAVLAHEMGHYARGHTRLGAHVYRGSVALRNTCLALRAARESGSHRRAIRVLWRVRSLYAYVAFCVFAAYSVVYDRVSFAARRRQEFQADACAAEHFGREVTADALRAAHALPVAWGRFQGGFLQPMRKAGYVPDDPFSAFEAMLSDPDYRDVLAELRVSPTERPVSRLDSHPALSQRLTALATAPAGIATGTAQDLLTPGERRSIAGDLGREMFGPGRASRASGHQEPLVLPWQEWASTTAALRAAAPAAELVGLAGRLAGVTDPAAVTLDLTLDLLTAGRGAELAGALAQGRADSPDAALTGALYALAGHYLAETGRAEWAVSWTGPSRLIATDILADELGALVGAAVRQPVTEVARLRLHLASLRLDPAATGPVSSLLRARASRNAIGLSAGPHDPAATVRIVADADLVTAQRIRTIRVLNIVVGVVTASVSLFGLLAWHSTHPQPAVTSPVPGAASPLQIPDPLATPPSASLPTPLPSVLLTPGLLKPRLLTSIIVTPGDSLSAIACRYQTTVRALQTLNRLGRSTVLVAGQRLNVPFTVAIRTTC